MNVVTTTDIKEYPLASRGKVRDIYELSPETLLIVTTDRLSAFDVVLPDPIPHKGIILNKITIFWMNRFAGLIGNHLLATEPADFPAALAPHADMLRGRAVVVKKARPLPIECIVRGYITGSGWKDYQATGSVCGHALPEGLAESAMLAEPIFTPSTKADLGSHDENITLAAAKDLVGVEIFNQVQDISIALYSAARDHARQRGILIADTKFEFGLTDNGLLLIDEVLTPDSSRFWPAAGYQPGRGQPSFDKQYVRDWLTDIGFNKKPPAPHMPEEVIQRTRSKYIEAYEFLTGGKFEI
ncbi:phosphoribosylaminoimidazolesuccinocarboxamide synthase [Desulfovibrio sulfodismutans]|uniref:Phosphoribosylaminoimidazole-succinocarboxamide synthase n=1 Tax=Desulfolutivibrio sulfodismutans TaxID=63561 RepID=A0A7K3NIJ9_9BACT|nr:phosphoribosylaminoimidazolesuccinocarboxamide synthase [Desulfolutivibrio sulfodismutans]NDY55615.1 phosphoribosylaminoimidazolesuccinocarboxamide synthase [Desulfolutivibrio sulfodismutans]QLA11683.1 phosphoribosylaminoimidazolesuccinocarboxamide synthase [Desulfolutivibrio sulfodismutans DSM 3696]